MDAYLGRKKIVKVAAKVKTGSNDELFKLGYKRLWGNSLINLAKQDLWTLTADGSIVKCVDDGEVLKEGE